MNKINLTEQPDNHKLIDLKQNNSPVIIFRFSSRSSGCKPKRRLAEPVALFVTEAP